MEMANQPGMLAQNGYQWAHPGQDVLSPPYQEDQLMSGFGFQSSPVPVTKDGW